MSDVGTSASFATLGENEENVAWIEEEEEPDLEFSMAKLCPILDDKKKLFDLLVARGEQYKSGLRSMHGRVG